MLPSAHVADHWLVYLIYSVPVITVVIAIVGSTLRQRRAAQARTDAGESAAADPGLSPEAPRGDDPGSP